MDHVLEITFQNMPTSAKIETMIRKRVVKLEKLYPRLIRCRVVVREPHRQHRTGNVPEVHVELQVPGKTLVVRRDRHAKERHATADVQGVVRDAFESATKVLLDYKDRQAHEVKAHPAPLPAHISDLFADRDYGFITTSEGKELYFHRNSVMDGPFDGLKCGDAVQFVESDGDTGPTAAKVWRATNG